MAFLDNSGDIILDAVLTATGRKKIAGGSAIAITKFALGDDEIDYGLYDKNHPSGSAYYDLEILQTPILQAFTQVNANINYGLIGTTNPNLLYLPTIVRNSLIDTKFGQTYGGLYYYAVNSETGTALSAEMGAGSTMQFMQGDNTNFPFVTYETGLDTTDLEKTATSRSNNVVATENGINDTGFIISVDARLISAIYGVSPSVASTYRNGVATNTEPDEPIQSQMSKYTISATSQNLANYIDFSINTAINEIYTPDTGGTAAQWSNIAGPGGRIVLFKPVVSGPMCVTKEGTTDQKYVRYGTVAAAATSIFAGSSTGYTYDFVDTSIILTGGTSGVTISVPLRIIRRAS